MTYSESYGISRTTRTILGDASLTLSFTKNWSVTTSAQYDFVAHQFAVPNIRIHRDLHCWELNFDYRPTGDIKGFNLEVRIKAEALRDIKLSRQESTYGTF
jgi:lipopolysaccharide assembly outer membrane protein LptD (OstA)